MVEQIETHRLQDTETQESLHRVFNPFHSSLQPFDISKHPRKITQLIFNFIHKCALKIQF